MLTNARVRFDLGQGERVVGGGERCTAVGINLYNNNNKSGARVRL